MSSHLHKAAAALGLLAIAWVASGYLQGPLLAHAPALAMSVLIAAAFVAGTVELHRFRQDTAGLQHALGQWSGPSAPPTDLADWLAQVPAPLRTAVRLRVDGERLGLPGPALTPYLVGLLVLLGMLGTFLGMVVTLNGTGLALESATDVQTMRDSLAAPVRGLGLAFGTSVAGVAASALLGLMSALSRRERVNASQALDALVATTLQAFSRTQRLAQQQAAQQAQQHEQNLQLLREQGQLQAAQQAQHLPALVQQLQALATQLAQQQTQSAEQLLARQQQFHNLMQDQAARQAESVQAFTVAQAAKLDEITATHTAKFNEATTAQAAKFNEVTAAHAAVVQQAYAALATSVDQTLQRSLAQSLAESSRIAAATLQPAVEATMAGITRETAALHGHIASTVQQQLDGFAQRFESRTGTWVDTLGTQLATQDSERLAAWAATLEQTASRITTEAEAQARSTVGEVARLVHAAAEAPRAAAEVVAQLRDKLSESLARDNAQLDERNRLMDTLNTLLGAVQHTATEQKAAIDRMVASTATWLDQAGARFTEQLSTESARMENMAAQLSGSAADVASLGEAFGTAVELFTQSTGQAVAQLQRVEEALAKSSARSDDQLAYYVAQAREVIDLSLLAQKQTVDELQRITAQQVAQQAKQAAAAAEAA